MSRPRRQVLLGAVCAAVLCAVALAGADRPPPPGFVILVALIVLWTCAVSLARWRTRELARWQQWMLTSLVGSASGLLVWFAMWMLAAPDSRTDGAAVTVGFLAAALAGLAGGTVLAIASWTFVDRAARA